MDRARQRAHQRPSTQSPYRSRATVVQAEAARDVARRELAAAALEQTNAVEANAPSDVLRSLRDRKVAAHEQLAAAQHRLIDARRNIAAELARPPEPTQPRNGEDTFPEVIVDLRSPTTSAGRTTWWNTEGVYAHDTTRQPAAPMAPTVPDSAPQRPQRARRGALVALVMVPVIALTLFAGLVLRDPDGTASAVPEGSASATAALPAPDPTVSGPSAPEAGATVEPPVATPPERDGPVAPIADVSDQLRGSFAAVTSDGIVLYGAVPTVAAADLQLAALADLTGEDVVDVTMERPRRSQVDHGRLLIGADHLGLSDLATSEPALSVRSREVLGRIAASAVEGSHPIGVSGYTDSHGRVGDNQRLSEEAAEAVAAELRSRGVSAEMIVVFGKAEDDPIGDNGTREGRRRNRRVEIVVHDLFRPEQ